LTSRARPYVLGVDRPHVEAFNRHASARHRLDLRMIPVPFMGNRSAPLLVLGLNPSYQRDSLRLDRDGNARGEALRANLGSNRRGHIHAGFNPEFAGTGSWRWWRRCFRAVIDEGHEPDELVRKVLAVDFHGYRSLNWRAIPVTLPSQDFGFELVRRAIRRQATIVVTRGFPQWHVAVPDLANYKSLVRLKNPRSATISPTNCTRRGFKLVRKALEGTEPCVNQS
jgi:hypothetical protein